MLLQIKSAIRKIGSLALFSLSICIGVASVFLINAISNFCIKSATLTLDRMGIDGYTITSQYINDCDMLQLKNCKYIDYISPIITASSKNLNDNDNFTFVGGNSQIKNIYSLSIEKGSFYNNNHILHADSVCVIGSKTAKELFNTTKCIGQSINISIKSFSDKLIVVGVYSSDKLSNTTGLETNEPIYVPYTTLNAINKQTVNTLLIKAINNDNISLCTNSIIKQCDSIFGSTNYKLKNTALERERINSLMTLIKKILEIIVGVSVLVSVLGLMVIMIININNKRKEIGLKKALGATDFTIVKEVSFESALISLIGVINGFLLYKLISIFINQLNIIDSKTLIFVPIITILSALIVGIIPAILAAKINPSVALKSEK